MSLKSRSEKSTHSVRAEIYPYLNRAGREILLPDVAGSADAVPGSDDALGNAHVDVQECIYIYINTSGLQYRGGFKGK